MEDTQEKFLHDISAGHQGWLGHYMNSHSAWGRKVLLSVQNIATSMATGFLQRLFPEGGVLPYLCPDQGLKAGLEVVKSAAVEPWHLIQQLFVLGLEVFPHRPQLFSGLGNKTLVSGLSLKGAGCGNSKGPGSAGPPGNGCSVYLAAPLPPPPAVPGGAWPAPGQSSPFPRTSPPWPAVSCSPARPAPAVSLPC